MKKLFSFIVLVSGSQLYASDAGGEEGIEVVITDVDPEECLLQTFLDSENGLQVPSSSVPLFALSEYESGQGSDVEVSMIDSDLDVSRDEKAFFEEIQNHSTGAEPKKSLIKASDKPLKIKKQVRFLRNANPPQVEKQQVGVAWQTDSREEKLEHAHSAVKGRYSRQDLWAPEMYGEMYGGISAFDVTNDAIFAALRNAHALTNKELLDERIQEQKKQLSDLKRFAFEEDLWRLVHVLYPRLISDYKEDVDLMKREYLAKNYLEGALVGTLEEQFGTDVIQQLWQRNNLDDPAVFQAVVRDLLWPSEMHFLFDQEVYHEGLKHLKNSKEGETL